MATTKEFKRTVSLTNRVLVKGLQLDALRIKLWRTADPLERVYLRSAVRALAERKGRLVHKLRFYSMGYTPTPNQKAAMLRFLTDFPDGLHDRTPEWMVDLFDGR